jgi:metal-sulfur cluster biosynthetic enzyme
MRNEVQEILDEIVEEDSTVTITFNMQWTPSWVD